MDLLRFITAGNVDDGKSTLIGRLLHDSRAILDDQMAAVVEASRRRGWEKANLALLTDGLRAEREQGITIDVAYRYFDTPKRKFIIADCPGHFQYTRNMVTGASTANLAVVLVDARKGIVEQTRRHCFVASHLRIPHLVICVNKMDLVEYSEAAFLQICREFSPLLEKLDIPEVRFIPISALQGDQVVERSRHMPWYSGPSLLEHLEHVPIAREAEGRDFRFPVQLVLAPPGGGRAYAGTIVSGSARVGDPVVALPSGFSSRIRSIAIGGRLVKEASAPASVALQLEDEIDISRGDMLALPSRPPTIAAQEVDLLLCWMSPVALEEGKRYLVRHTTSESFATISEVAYKIDIHTGEEVPGPGEVGLNDFARVRLRAHKPLMCDAYRSNRATGSLILVDDETGDTVAAGMIL